MVIALRFYQKSIGYGYGKIFFKILHKVKYWYSELYGKGAFPATLLLKKNKACYWILANLLEFIIPHPPHTLIQ